MGSFVVVARWTAREGEQDAVARALARLIGPTRAEPGVLVYQAHRDPDDDRVFLLYEQYRDRAAYADHLASPHVQAHGWDDAIPRLEARERRTYETWDPTEPQT